MRVVANGVDLHLIDSGSGHPALVFLHYFGGSARAWDGVVGQLAGDHRCVAIDLRGFGDSAAPNEGYAVGDTADDVAAVVRALALEDYVLVGHSMGGKVALALAGRRPAGLRALVLVAPSPPTPEPIPDDERERLLAAHGDRAAAARTARRLAARPLPAAALEQVVADAVRTSASAWAHWLAHGSREDVSDAAARVDIPTLVIAARADPSFPPSLLEREVVRRVAGAEMAVVSNAGHLVPIEAPAATAALVREHCRSR